MKTLKIRPIYSAYNSKLIKIIFNKKKYIIKLYPNKKTKQFLYEFFFLKIYSDCNNIPKIFHSDYNNKSLVIKYLAGKKINKNQSKYIGKIIQFLGYLQKKKKFFEINKIYAQDACLKFEDHLNNTYSKIKNLEKKIKSKNSSYLNFIKDLKIRYDTKKKNIEKQYSKTKICKKNLDRLIVSPSDFGFNNILKKNNKIYFIDFEYAGLDDPLKLCFDFLSNPNTKMPKIKKLEFLRKFAKKFKINNIIKIYNDLIDFYYLKWAIIILNYHQKKNKSNLRESIKISKNYLNKEYGNRFYK